MIFPVFCYVLTCSKTSARLAAFDKTWDATDAPDLGVARPTVVWGMNSDRFPRSPFWRVGSEQTDRPDRESGNGLDRRGHTACYWGHVQEWRQALGEHDADFDRGAAVFFEDDCELDRDFWTQADAAMRELPDDWEILYFGGELCVHGRPAPDVYSERLFKADNVNRTHAYSVKLSALPKIILWFEENHDWGHNFKDPKTGQSEAEVDYALGSLTESGYLNGYALREWICGQAAGFSWTQGRQEPARRWPTPLC